MGIRNDVGLWDEGSDPPGWAEYSADGAITGDGITTVSPITTFAAGDIISVACNMDDGEIQWFKNNAVLSGGGAVAIDLPTTTQNGFITTVNCYPPDEIQINFGNSNSTRQSGW